MNGVAKGEFAGDEFVTRGQLATVLKNLDDAGKFAEGNAPTVDPNPKDPNPAIPVSNFPELVTTENFNAITIGMTYKEVETMLGSGGSASAYEQGGILHVVWKNAEYKIIHVYFLGGVVSQKISAL